VTVLDDTVEGWAAWVGDQQIDVSITGGGDMVTARFDPDPFHPLSGRHVRAVSFNLARPRSHAPQSVRVSIDGEIIHAARAPGNESDLSPSDRRGKTDASLAGGTVTVIVPVYADYEATKACLDSLLSQLTVPSHRALLVDDATPDSRIARYLARAAAKPGVGVLTNSKNLGFVGAVNRALDQIDGGDILLLNADTVVPAGFIERLATAAYCSPDIGTVTPLSNNGEFTSFPVANRSNPLESRREISRIDEIAARVNAGRVVDIPNGIGFCLYITRECLDAVGPLSESFHRGYLEDVDFCLRAREAGFRNVCAPSIYVGHAGSRSFKEEKRSLVVRNLDVIARRFPRYRSECAAFILADPLRASREAIERAASPRNRRPRLLVTGTGVVGAVANERASHLSADEKSVLVMEIMSGARGLAARLRAPGGSIPQSVRFDLSSPGERRSMLNYLRRVKACRIEIADPANVPASLVDLLLELDVPHDVFIADAGLLVPPHAPMSCEAVTATAENAGVEGNRNPTEDAEKDRQHRWRAIARRADRILVPCDQAGALAAQFLPKRKTTKVGRAPSHRIANPRGRTGIDLGLLPIRLHPQEHRLMLDIALAFSRSRPNVSLLVLGETLDDLALLRVANTYVTGPLDATELGEAFRGYGLQALFLCTTLPLFGHPAQTVALNAPVRAAYFDWSAGRCRPRRGDLPIDPRASFQDVVSAIGAWV
jgi:GT2 family glycosyltransferase